ncbi:MAG: alpha/beta hydrolase [candidate division Zixibacteria bacterium]|nr:alpha/beta hydrolase [candidate division Zixibacteria bacterium]
MKFIRMAVGFLIFVGALFLAFGTYLYFHQTKLVFYPSREMVMTPDELNLTHREVFIEVEHEEKIHGWYFPAAEPTSRTILFCHGNAGNISRRIYTAQFLCELGVNVLLFDYRGYGLSDGTPSEHGAYADAIAAYDWLVDDREVPPAHVFIFGRSLGGAVAVETASRVTCGGVIVESSFTSAPDLGQQMFPWYPVRLLARYQFDTASKIGSLKCPVLVTHSPEDQLIPYAMGRTLYERASEPKQFIDLSGDHNDRGYYDNEQYIRGLRVFLGLQ